MKKKTRYSFELDKDKIERFRHLTAREKLTWLYEVNLFLHKVLTLKQKKIWKKNRNGTL